MRSRAGYRPRTRIVLRTLCFFDALLLVLVGFVAAFFVDGAVGPIVGAACWLAAGGLLALGRWIDPNPTWGWDP